MLLESTARARLQESRSSLAAAQPVLIGLPLFYAVYAGASMALGSALADKPFAPLDMFEHDEFGPFRSQRALAGWAAALVAYLVLGPLVLCAAASLQCRGGCVRLGAPRHDPLDVAHAIASVQLLLTLLLKPPFPENVAWWLTVLPCMLTMGHVARWLLLVPRRQGRAGAASSRRAAAPQTPRTPRSGGGGKGSSQCSSGATPRVGARPYDSRRGDLL